MMRTPPVVSRAEYDRRGEKHECNQEKGAQKNKGFINAGTHGNQPAQRILCVYTVYSGQ
jgi:hypothetical protein